MRKRVLTMGAECGRMGVGREPLRKNGNGEEAEMRKIWLSGEVRGLVGKLICIVLSTIMSVMCIVMGNVFVALVSFTLMAFLCMGLGYSWSKNEEQIGTMFAEREEAELAVPNYEAEVKADVFEEKVDESVDNGENV